MYVCMNVCMYFFFSNIHFLKRFFLTAILLPHCQYCAIIEWGQPHSLTVNHCLLRISTQRSPRAS